MAFSSTKVVAICYLSDSRMTILFVRFFYFFNDRIIACKIFYIKVIYDKKNLGSALTSFKTSKTIYNDLNIVIAGFYLQ